MSTRERSLRRDSVVVAEQQVKQWSGRLRPFLGYMLGALASIDFVMIIIGSIYFHRCTAGPRIPLFLICNGIFQMVAKLATHLKNTFQDYRSYIKYVESFFQTTSIVLFISGSVWTYKIYKPSYDENETIYCNKTCYLFTFILITFVYSTLLLMVVVVSCGLLFTLCFGTAEDDKKESQQNAA